MKVVTRKYRFRFNIMEMIDLILVMTNSRVLSDVRG